MKTTITEAIKDLALAFLKAGKTKEDFMKKMEKLWDEAEWLWRGFNFR